jgi:acetyl esterase/lipase
LRAYLLKALLSSADLIGRAFIFNREPPPVRGVVSGLSYGKHRQQRLDVVLPNGPPPYPTLLYIHGGGWIAGDKKSYERICRLFASEGHLVLNMNYRLAPRHHFPAPAQDVALAVQWAHAHGERWGADLSTLFLAGDSAGAHLASLDALALGRPELLGAIGVEGDGSAQAVQGLVLFYGVYDLTRFAADAPPYVRAIVNAFLGPGGDLRRADYNGIKRINQAGRIPGRKRHRQNRKQKTNNKGRYQIDPIDPGMRFVSKKKPVYTI